VKARDRAVDAETDAPRDLIELEAVYARARSAPSRRSDRLANFKNRNELFIALGQTYWSAIAPDVSSTPTFAEKMQAYAEAAIAAVPERRSARAAFQALSAIRRPTQ
jgi:hypothetical protein